MPLDVQRESANAADILDQPQRILMTLGYFVHGGSGLFKEKTMLLGRISVKKHCEIGIVEKDCDFVRKTVIL